MDLSKIPTTLAGKISATRLISRMEKLSEEEIRLEFLNIIRDSELNVSKITRMKWEKIANYQGKIRLMEAITNLYLKAADLGVSP